MSQRRRDADDNSEAAEQPPVLSREQVRAVDRRAAEDLGMPTLLLMENAGLNATEIIIDVLQDNPELQEPADARVAVVCGGGNNGGDGYVIARHLHNLGVDVQIFAARALDSLQGDAAVNAGICQRMDIPIGPVLDERQIAAAAKRWRDVHVIVDALLGSGFSGEVREPEASLIRAMNDQRQAQIVAIDVPSGLDCDTGRPSKTTVRAKVTVTFVAVKKGFLESTARPFLGDLLVADIGTPPSLVDQVINELS